jgi:pimeloyl-ACP methyl ester carboxylesterase
VIGTRSPLHNQTSTRRKEFFMPVVFVNGIPESAAIWEPLLAELNWTEVVLLSPPGFGAPIPDGFDCTLPSYTQWLAEELAALGEPADLVGHDLGGAAVAGVAMTRPELVRTWVSDVLSVFDPDYAWHKLAQVYQTPGAGEKMVADRMGGTLSDRTEGMAALVHNKQVAARLAAAQGPETGRALLAFYRWAVQPAMAELGRNLHLAAKRPGLAVIPTEDVYVGSLELRRRSAARAGARAAVLHGLGHWWMTQDPVRGARALDSFWAESRLAAR